MKPDIKIAGIKYKRVDIINKLIVIENTTTRNSSGHTIERIVADLGSMKFYSINEAYKLIPKQ